MAHENEHGQHDPRGHEREQYPKVTVTGNIGQIYDAELYPRRDGSGDLLVFRFSVAQHDAKGETTWYKVVMFDDKAQAMQQRFADGELRVGQQVVVAGRLREQEYVSRRSGQPGVDRQIYPYNPASVRAVPPPAPKA